MPEAAVTDDAGTAPPDDAEAASPDDTETASPDGAGVATADDPIFHVDGELVPASDATVNVQDRGFAYGDAAFETLRAYDGRIFRWEAHADRLADTCDALELEHGLSRADLRTRIAETLNANEFDDAYVKLSISRGVQPGKLTPSPDVDPTVVVYAKPLPRGGTAGTPVWDEPAELQTVKTRRVPDAAIPSHAKTHNYLNGILARLETRVTDADEAMLLDDEGHVAEGATSNLFFVTENALRTPTLGGPVLPGITRDVVLDLAASEEIPVEEGRYEPADVRDADEVFLTNSTWEIRPVTTVDGIEKDIGPITKLLSTLFDRRVEAEFYE